MIIDIYAHFKGEQCVKCHGRTGEVRYIHGVYQTWNDPDNPGKLERLHEEQLGITCSVCGYQWTRPTLDAEPEQ